MKIIKGLSFFFLGAILFTACFNPPEFSSIPEIEFNSVDFKSTKAVTTKDTLILTINFKDGDGDLGVSPNQSDFDFNDVNFYLAVEGAPSQPIGYVARNEERTNRIITPLITVPNGIVGTLISSETRLEANYDTIPILNSQKYKCNRYSYFSDKSDSIYVRESDKNIFKGKYIPVDSLILSDGDKVYILYNQWYARPNVAHYNIRVRFYIKNSDATYTEFDWEKEECSPFYARFPVLSENNSPLEGVLKYKMVSNGFIPDLGGKTIKLRVQISDNAGHLSNAIESPDFGIQ